MFKIVVKLKSLIPREKIQWSNKQLDMKDDVIKDYNIKKGIIFISSDNKILDGNHRYDILINHFGGEHEVIVKRIPIKKRLYLILITPFLIILSPIILILAIILAFIKK